MEIASEHLGLYEEMKHKLGVKLPSDALKAVEQKFGEDDPTQDMYDGIFATIEQLLTAHFRVWVAEGRKERPGSASSSAINSPAANAPETTAPSPSKPEAALEDATVAAQPANVTNQRLMKKFGDMPKTPRDTTPRGKEGEKREGSRTPKTPKKD